MKRIILLIAFFVGSTVCSEAEFMRIEFTSPGTFKADTGRFSDAYYVMRKIPISVKAKIFHDSLLDAYTDLIKLKIYQENSDGTFDNIPFIEQRINISVNKNDSFEIEFFPISNTGKKFVPKTYHQILQNNPEFEYHDHFSNMLENVTPRYLIVLDSLPENLFGLSSISRIVRFYLNAVQKYILSVENSMIDLNSNSSKDLIAGRLNSDSLILNFKEIFHDENDPFQNYCIFERTNWEENAIDYSSFDCLFWSDGDDKPIIQTERKNIINYLESGTTSHKKNLMICSQELAREHGIGGSVPDSLFLTDYLRSFNYPPGNPKGKDVSCDSIQIKGVAINRDFKFNIINTLYESDSPPYCGIVKRNDFGEGLPREAALYFPDSNFIENKLPAGMTITKLTINTVYLTIDWRHFENPEYIIRSGMDYFDKNTNGLYKVYFTNTQRLDSNLNNYPGDLIFFQFRFGYYWSDMGTPSYYYYFSNRDILIWNPFYTSYDTIWTDRDGYTTYKFQIPEDTQPGDYYLRLYTIEFDTKEKIKVNTKLIRVDDIINNSGALSVYPNPTHHSTSIEFTLDKTSNATIAIFDALGNKVKQFDLGFKEQGTHCFNMDTYDLSQGLYFIKLQAGERVVMGKMVIIQ